MGLPTSVLFEAPVEDFAETAELDTTKRYAPDGAGGTDWVPGEHASTHLPGGTDALTTAVPADVGTTAIEGADPSFANSAHVHRLTEDIVRTVVAGLIADLAVNGQKITGLGAPAAATDAATRGYVDDAVVGLLQFIGSTDCSTNPNYPAANKGDAYIVSVAGKIGGVAGMPVDIGDVYVASADNAGGTQAAVGTSWFILEHNLQGALLSANNLSDLLNAPTARTNLGLGTIATEDALSFLRLAGVAGGQTVRGGTAAGEDLTLSSTANGAKGSVLLGALGGSAYDEVNNRLGVGTAVPSYKLDVSDTVAGAEVTSRVVHGNNSNVASHAIQRITTGGASGGDPKILLNVDGGATYYIGLDNSDGDKFMIGFFGAVGGSVAMTIDSFGLVGLGTTTPTAKLHVVGAATNLATTNIGFFGTAPVVKPTVTGARGGNAALASLLTGLAGLGLITNSSTA